MRLLHALTIALALISGVALEALADPHRSNPMRDDWRRGGQVPLGFSQSVSGRFGVQMQRDGLTGETRMEPLAELGYRINWQHESDSGWRFGVSVGISASNYLSRRASTAFTGH